MSLLSYLSHPEKMSTKGLLSKEQPFFLIGFGLSWALGLVLCYLPQWLPLEWHLSKNFLLLQQSVFSALMGRLVWETVSVVQKQYRSSLKNYGKIWPVLLAVAFASLYLSLGFSFLRVVVLTVFSYLLVERIVFLKIRLNEVGLFLALVFYLGVFCTVAFESFAFLIWDAFFEFNSFLITPATLLEAVFLGYALPVPMSLGGAAFLGFELGGWQYFSACFLLYGLMFRGWRYFQRSKGAACLKTSSSFQKSLELPFVIAASLSFLKFLSQFPAALNWGQLSLFVAMLTLALSIRNWGFWGIVSIGVVVFLLQIGADALSGGMV